MSFKFTKQDKVSELHPNITKFLGTFIQNRIDEYKLFKSAVDQNDMASVRMYCHKVVGIAASYKCYKLEEMALYIQKCSRENDVESIKSSICEFDAYMQEISTYKS